MTDLKKNTATVALIALMSAAPMAAFATESGSPQQSVDADPDEYADSKKVTDDDSVVSDMETGSPAQSVDTDDDESVADSGNGEGSIADELPTNSPAISDS